MLTCLTSGLMLLAVLGCADYPGEEEVAGGEWHGAWIDSAAIVRLGADDDLPLYQVRGAVLSGDTIVVAERSTGQLHFFNRGGEFLKSVGGLGEGPGEFRMLGSLHKAGEQLYVYDYLLRRLSVFATDGSYLRSVQIRPAEGYSDAALEAVLADGCLLVAAYPLGDGPYTGFYRRTEILLRYDAEGSYMDSLLVYQAAESFEKTHPDGGQTMGRVPFGKRTAAEAYGTQFYLIENNDFTIEVFDQSGGKLREMRASNDVQAPVSAEHARAKRMRHSPRVRDELPMPDSFPPYGWHGLTTLGLAHVSSVGDLWVLNGEDLPAWTVFTEDGTERGHVRALEVLDVLDADDEIALVLHRDDLDVETVQVRRIRQ